MFRSHRHGRRNRVLTSPRFAELWRTVQPAKTTVVSTDSDISLPLWRQNPLDFGHSNLVLIEQSLYLILLDQSDAVEFGVLPSLGIKALIRYAHLAKAGGRMSMLIERCATNNFLHRIPPQLASSAVRR